MKIFVSSVRRGLETERDALPGLIAAIGHEPRRFEEFGAQAVPSREACLRGVAESDVYLLLLGSAYGHVFPETGQSATHDEWTAAVTAGMPRLVFRKTGVDMEPEQEAFALLVGDYGTGVFYAEYENAVDLQSKVAGAIRSLADLPGALAFVPLDGPVRVQWRGGDGRQAHETDPWLELHSVPLRPARRSARQLRDLPDRLASGLRAAGALPQSSGLRTVRGDDKAAVELEPPTRHWNTPSAGSLSGVAVNTEGQVSLWWFLPPDGLGTILDPDNLRETVAAGLRLLGALRLATEDHNALAIGIGGSTTIIGEGRVAATSRTSATLGHRSGPTRVEPDEAVTAAAFGAGADEVAGVLTTSLLDAFRRRG